MGSNPAAPTKQTPTNSGFLHFSVTVARARKTNKVAPKSWIATKSPGKNPGLCSSVREPFAASSRASVSRAPQQSHVRKTVKRKTRSAPNRAGSNLEGHTRPMVPIECDMRSEVGLVAEPGDCRRQVRIFPPPTQMSNQQPVTTAGEKVGSHVQDTNNDHRGPTRRKRQRNAMPVLPTVLAITLREGQTTLTETT